MEIARIQMDGGALLLPARTPYEREVVLEHVRHRLRLYGFVHLEMNGRRLKFEPVAATAGVACAVCRRHVGMLACRLAAQMLCVHCAVAPERSSRGTAALSSQPLAG